VFVKKAFASSPQIGSQNTPPKIKKKINTAEKLIAFHFSMIPFLVKYFNFIFTNFAHLFGYKYF